MPTYRRNYLPGGTYFFTVNLRDRHQPLLTDHIDALRAAVRYVIRKRPFTIDAWVVLPEHLHCVWTLPDGDSDYSGRWRAIKTAFSKSLPGDSFRNGEKGIWQRRYWEHTITSLEDYRAYIDYVHINPVKHGWVKRVSEWPYSTFHRYVERGVYSADWGGGAENSLVGDTGERIIGG